MEDYYKWQRYVLVTNPINLLCFLIQLTRSSGVTLTTSFMFVTIGIVPVLISTIAMLPRSRIPWPLPANYGKGKGDECKPKNWNRRMSGEFLWCSGQTCYFCKDLVPAIFWLSQSHRHQLERTTDTIDCKI